MQCTLYKAIDGRQTKDRDFESFAEQGREGIDPEECQSWGLSVWTNEPAVMHARKAYHFFRKKKIIMFSIMETDGCLKATPSNRQPEHHTFWKTRSVDLVSKSQVVHIEDQYSDG